MNLLYANDRRGEYPKSWYAAAAKPLAPCPALMGSERADVCVIGAGFTGISTALHLAELGYSVTILEAQRIGFGASGRNGGQLGMGQRMDQDDLIDLLGGDAARVLWKMALDAQALVKSLINKFDIDCDLTPGVANLGHTPRLGDQMRQYADFLRQTYHAAHVQSLSVAEGRRLCVSEAYHGGFIDWNSAH
ncbi:MAG: FAD-binding oxidoreductase, partial [Rhodobacteraceae bacterium]|nr:FAD-binding oxidoreductase [Paracoccaceae bacterium]